MLKLLVDFLEHTGKTQLDYILGGQNLPVRALKRGKGLLCYVNLQFNDFIGG